MSTCRAYFEKTGRRISFEYALIDGVNDAPWQADLMVRRLRGMPGHVNLIALNDIAESPLKPSRRMAAFQQQLEERGVTATVRRRLGLGYRGSLRTSCAAARFLVETIEKHR